MFRRNTAASPEAAGLPFRRFEVDRQGRLLRFSDLLNEDLLPERFQEVFLPGGTLPSPPHGPFPTWHLSPIGSPPCGSRGPSWRCAPARTTLLPLPSPCACMVAGEAAATGEDSRFPPTAVVSARPCKEAAYKAEASARPAGRYCWDGAGGQFATLSSVNTVRRRRFSIAPRQREPEPTDPDEGTV